MSSTEIPPSPHLTRPFARLARGASGVVLVLIVVAVVSTMLVPALLGFNLYAIAGGSMEPTIQRGALAYAREVPVSRLRVGDVITYVPPGHSQPVTHRVSQITRPERSKPPVYQTKGDANARPDLRIFRLDRPTQARYIFSLPFAGWVLLFLSSPLAKVLVLGVPAVLVALWVVASLWREGGRLLRDREDAAAAEYEALDEEDEALATATRAVAR